MARKQSKTKSGAAWYENWWAGEDLDAISRGTSNQKSKSRRDRDAALRWAKTQRPKGGVIRRMFG